MKPSGVSAVAVVIAVGAAVMPSGCVGKSVPPGSAERQEPALEKRAVDVDSSFTLARQRSEFRTKIFHDVERGATPVPPAEIFELVRYPAPLGSNSAYVTPSTAGPPRPAIIWINGGFDWSTGGWMRGPRENDQSAMIFNQPGIVLMRPSLRGSNDNPGRNECFLGEVDDIIAALAYLRERKDVDPNRVYLAGHSTGATMVLLVGASTDAFRAIFAFGPVADPRGYGDVSCIPPETEGMEAHLRAPINFVSEIRTPTYLIEGAEGGNADSCRKLMSARGTAPVEFLEIPGGNHFNIIAPGSEVVARAILRDTGDQPSLELDVQSILAGLEQRSPP